MDSKSIARKGVGVRVPSLVPAPAGGAREAGERYLAGLAAALLPTVLGRVGRYTAELHAASTALAREAFAHERGLPLGLDELLERLPDETPHDGAPTPLERTGWCLAVVGTLAGADLLRGRQEPWGPLALAELVHEARALGGGVVGETDVHASPPEVEPVRALRATARGRGFEVAVLVADLVAAAGASDVLEAEHHADGHVRLRCSRGSGGPDRTPLWPGIVPPALVEALVPGALRLDGTAGQELHLPPGWVQPLGSRVG